MSKRKGTLVNMFIEANTNPEGFARRLPAAERLAGSLLAEVSAACRSDFLRQEGTTVLMKSNTESKQHVHPTCQSMIPRSSPQFSYEN